MNGALLVSKQRFICLARPLPDGKGRRARAIAAVSQLWGQPGASETQAAAQNMWVPPASRISAHREGVSHLCIIHSRSLRIAPSFDGGIVFACKSLPIFSHFIYFLFFTTFLTFQNSSKILLPSFFLLKKKKKKCFLYLKTTQSRIRSCQNLLS